MSKNGSPKTKRPSWWLFIVGGLGLVLALFIVTQVAGVFYAIIFPAPPPLPAEVTQLSHESNGHGVDEWLYGTDVDPCDILAYYQDRSNSCRVSDGVCGSNPIDVNAPGQHVARCSGMTSFSIFGMRWSVNIATGYTSESGGRTQFQLQREVLWSGGAIPTSTP